MKLPIPFIKSKKSKNEYYLALLLDDEKIASVILEEEGGKAKIIGKHEEYLSSPLETISQDELIAIVDKTISRAEEVLPPDIETHKTVFGVKESWIEKETKKINKDHLSKLKKVCDALSLSPIGFMVISEAIANLLQDEDGAPLSAILVELGSKTVHVTLFRGGKISESTSGPIEHSAPMSVDTLLKKFIAPVLPTKIILAHNKESKNLNQHFAHHEWSKNLPFLHVPKVTILPEDFDAKAVSYGAASQMGFEILGLEKITTEHELHKDTSSDITEDTETSEDLSEKVPSTENFGFIAEQDIATRPQEEIAKDVVPEKPNSHENLDSEALMQPEEDYSEKVNLRHTDISEGNDFEQNQNTAKGKKNTMAGLKAFFPPLTFLKTIQLPGFMKNNKKVKLTLIFLGGIVILTLSVYALYFYNVKAEVVLSLKPNEVTKEENITFSTSTENDFAENIIAAKSISTSLDGELTTPATGKKDTGEKAKGTVTIYNNADSPLTIGGGTEIKSSNGLTFTTDKEIKLASASGDIFTGTKPGTAQVGVTAKDIGTESNLPSNTKFTVGNNNTLAAKNDNAFSGGTKKAVTVVSKNDIAKLRSDLPKSLEKKAIEDLSGKNGSDETVLPGFVKVSITDEDFDKEIDDEAKQVKLKATVQFEGMSYKNSDIEDFDKSILKDDYADDISFAEKSLKNEVRSPKVKNENEMQALLSIKAGLLPKIDSQEVTNKIQGKSAGQAKEILSTIPQVIDSDVKYSPNILFLANIFPRLPKTIQVTVSSD